MALARLGAGASWTALGLGLVVVPGLAALWFRSAWGTVTAVWLGGFAVGLGASFALLAALVAAPFIVAGWVHGAKPSRRTGVALASGTLLGLVGLAVLSGVLPSDLGRYDLPLHAHNATPGSLNGTLELHRDGATAARLQWVLPPGGTANLRTQALAGGPYDLVLMLSDGRTHLTRVHAGLTSADVLITIRSVTIEVQQLHGD